ncbi:MFS transporter [Neisseria chenwenguii]|uniref:MFS transporter n=1 Tax=Neisseria chenwenguii TaxID=1853278 RepID=A0A220S1L5_9NEIS|nr:MFS transporter [Neisseria chenwenguii]ASK27303.1 MFS transporter [Neisseria chenwenguii]ROV57022.1 MFS transporter [Neisseria chenwenguii]
MKHLGIKLALFINYFVFAILLNSVGIVIKQSLANYGVTETEASILEAFKDLPIAVVSFFVASFLPKFGYKNSMLLALALVFGACLYMFFGNSFGASQVLFLCIGVAFAFIKVSVYSMIGLFTETKEQHNSFMSSIEGFFMIGIASAYFLFPAFFDAADPNAWLRVYLLLAGLIAVAFFLLLFTKVDVDIPKSEGSLADDFTGMLKLVALPLTIFFILSAFCFVMVEQGIMTWLPTFNEKVLSLNDTLSVQMASILALSLAAGRFLAGQLVKKIHWVALLTACLLISAAIVAFVLPQALNTSPQTIHSFSEIPAIGFIFPLIGLFIAPVYPLISSATLSALPQRMHSSMTGLIVIFSALGGTLGSRIIGMLFEHVGGAQAFYFMLIPIAVLIIALLLLNKFIKDYEHAHPQN